ncbi:hypothetical protein R3P38DRAFT_2812403 [Favolaschia claudopus]|uniref:DUF6589 domain-containing protein n=1 Tax=Favolaschia claudopus TaxID=2862362 RepID=A0AAV9Z6Y1_9AGAR
MNQIHLPPLLKASASSPPTTPVARHRLVRRNSLPGSSPIPTSPEESPKAGATALDLPPLSSDGLIYTSPIVGSKEERKAISYAKGQRKRAATIAAVAAEKKTREEIFHDVLAQLEAEGLTIGDLMVHVFDPINKQGQTRWNGFFRRKGLASTILNLWTSRENSETARDEVQTWAVNFVAEQTRSEAQAITESKGLFTSNSVNAAYVDGFSMRHMYEFLQKHAKTATRIFEAFSTSVRNLKGNLPSRVARRALIVTSSALTLLGEYSQRNNFSRRIMAIYLYASGAQRQTISVLAHLGISESYQNLIQKPRFLINRRRLNPEVSPPPTPPPTPTFPDNSSPQVAPDPVALSAAISSLRSVRMGTLRQLSNSMRDMARAVAATGLYAASYDNINMVFRAAEQILGKTDSQENGTCSTIWPLWKAALEDMNIKNVNAAFNAASPLSIRDILLSSSELQMMDQCLQHCILRIIIDQGGEKFQKFRAALDAALPVTVDKIELHKTLLHPLPAWNIDESTIVGNEEVVDAIHEELKVKGLSHWNWAVKFFCGDQLTIARLRSLLSIRAGHEGGYSGFGWGIWMPGLFHSKIADMHGFFVTHWGVPNRGTRNPGSLFFHNTHLHRSPILLSSLPPFRVCRDLVFVSLYARVLHCLLLVTQKATLDESADSVETFEQLQAHAATIQKKFANGSVVSELRWKRKTADGSEAVTPGDEIFENACLLLRDALISRELTDSIKAGDSGRIVLVLKVLALSYRGNGRTKYAYEMLHLIHNLTHVWPPAIRKIVLNNWLVNPTGNPFSWVEVDLMQEHMNYWIKTIYQAHGSGASWEWLEMISPCISVLRRLSTSIRQILGSDQGTKHEPANLKEDISLLMASLKEHAVYEVKGRVFAEGDGSPTPDVIAVGAQQLTDGASNPLTEYNTTFTRLQCRLRLKPLVGTWDESDTPIIADAEIPSQGQNLVVDLHNEQTSEGSEGEASDSEGAEEQPSALQQLMEDDNEPTLTRDTAADVSLDMDTANDDFLFADRDADDLYTDDGAIDDSDDEYLE